jgi:hypothetical protein
MTEHISQILEEYPAPGQKQIWWGHVWRGLVVSGTARHYKAMGRSVWLFLYLVIHADRKTGTLYRKTGTISKDIGMSARTVQVWLRELRGGGYIVTKSTGRSLIIQIAKWRPIRKAGG